MQVQVKGRGMSVTDELREHVEQRFRRVAAQVSDRARLEVEVREARTPDLGDHCVVEATLALKGTTLRARDRGRDVRQALHLVEEELCRQVKRHRDKRRNHRKIGTETIRTMPAAFLPPVPGMGEGARPGL